MEETLKQIRQKLYLLRDGASSASMREKGLNYKMNWGVPVTTLRNLAKEYPDPALAELLWQQNTRELKIMATMIADPKTFADADKWLSQINTPELAEQAVMNLFSKLPDAPAYALSWLMDEDIYARLTAVLLLTRLIMQGYSLTARLEECLPRLVTFLADASLSINVRTINLLERLAEHDEPAKTLILSAINAAPLSASLKENLAEVFC